MQATQHIKQKHNTNKHKTTSKTQNTQNNTRNAIHKTHNTKNTQNKTKTQNKKQ